MLTSARACWEDVSANILDVLDLEHRCQAIYEIAMVIEMDSVKGGCFYTLAESQFHIGILAIQVSYRSCFKLF